MNQPGTTRDPAVAAPRLHPRDVTDRRLVRRTALRTHATWARPPRPNCWPSATPTTSSSPPGSTPWSSRSAHMHRGRGYLDERRLSRPDRSAGGHRRRPTGTTSTSGTVIRLGQHGDDPRGLRRRRRLRRGPGALRGHLHLPAGRSPTPASTCNARPARSSTTRHRPGLWTMVRQHHYYGIGMTEVIERHGLPGGAQPSGLLQANKQRVTQRSVIHMLRLGRSHRADCAGWPRNAWLDAIAPNPQDSQFIRSADTASAR